MVKLKPAVCRNASRALKCHFSELQCGMCSKVKVCCRECLFPMPRCVRLRFACLYPAVFPQTAVTMQCRSACLTTAACAMGKPVAHTQYDQGIKNGHAGQGPIRKAALRHNQYAHIYSPQLEVRRN